ncbi:hypothetical protein D3C87_2208530 [compost metagenome]
MLNIPCILELREEKHFIDKFFIAVTTIRHAIDQASLGREANFVKKTLGSG